VEIILQGHRSRLLKIWIRRKNDHTGPRYVFTQNIKVTHGNNVPRGHIKITQNLDSQKKNITLDTGAQNIQITWTNDIPWGQIKMTNNLDSQKIQLHWVPNIFTRNMKIAYGSYIQRGHIKINQNLDSLETRLHGASGFLPKACGLHMEMISHGDRSRLVKIWIRRIYNYTRRQYLYSRFAKNTITLGLNICTQSMMITYGHDILWRQIKIV
jgi:hypothetical protein